MQLDHSLPSRLPVLFGALLFLAGCSGSSPSTPDTTPTVDAGGQTAVDSGAQSQADASMAAAEDSGTPTSNDGGSSGGPVAAIGPIPVAASQEKTVCIIKRLDNPEAMLATSFVSDLAPGSHHLIVYRSDATAEQTTPVACNPFQGILSGDVPLVIVTEAHLEYDLPKGVGIQLGATQMVKIEAHYINTTAAPINGNGTVAISGVPLADAGSFQEANVGLWGTTQIQVPPNASFSTPVNFQVGVAGTNIFALTTHEHQLGTEAQVWSSANAGDVSNQLADDKNWAAPALETFTPPIALNGTNGLSYKCSWTNATSTAVSFGESALNEMCFVILYYYPSFGTDLCLDGNCMGRPAK